jgi:chromosomal replication initiation ATPase DnaA
VARPGIGPDRDPGGRQRPLAFGAPTLSTAAFIASDETEEARRALGGWRDWPGGVFALVGEAQCGKSHLGRVWAEEVGARVVAGAGLDMREALSGEPPLRLCVDDGDRAEARALFALLTRVEREGGAVLLIGASPPGEWPVALPDLRSRLKACAWTRVRPPEPALLAQLLIRHAAAAGYRLEPEAARWLAARMPRAFESVPLAVAAFGAVAGRGGPPRTAMGLVRAALAATWPEPEAGDLFESDAQQAEATESEPRS